MRPLLGVVHCFSHRSVSMRMDSFETNAVGVWTGFGRPHSYGDDPKVRFHENLVPCKKAAQNRNNKITKIAINTTVVEFRNLLTKYVQHDVIQEKLRIFINRGSS